MESLTPYLPIILVLLVVLSTTVVVQYISRDNESVRAKAETENALSEIKKRDGEIADLKKEVSSLSAFKEVRDLAERENVIRQNTESMVRQAESDAAAIRSQAKVDAGQVRAAADEDAKSKRDSSNKALENANRHAKQIIDEANDQAKKIAGDAYRALQEADGLKEAAKAMRNVIEGYG